MLLLCFFIPALWRGYTEHPSYFKIMWDGCEMAAIFLKMVQPEILRIDVFSPAIGNISKNKSAKIIF
jgi:hypothetical protein